jgi:hypothetical protein
MEIPEKYKALVTPNSAAYLKGISAKVSKLIEKNSSEKKSYIQLLDSQFMLKERAAYLSSKRGIGVSAIAQTSHAIAQLVPVLPTYGIKIRFPHNQIEETPSFSGLTINKGTRTISNVIAQVTDGFADVTKSKFLADVGITDQTAKNFLVLARLGVNPESVILFNNQPAIREFLRLKAIYKNISRINPDVHPISDKYLFTEIAKKFEGPTVLEKAYNSNKIKFYTDKEMLEMLESYDSTNSKSLSSQQKVKQTQMLADYIYYDALAWNIFNFTQATNWATDRGGDPNIIRRKNYIYDYTKREIPISSVDALMDHTYIGNYRTNALRINEAIKSLFATQQGQAGRILDRFAIEDSSNKFLKKDDYASVMLKKERSMLDHVIQTRTNINGQPLNHWIEALTTGPTSTANYIKAMKESDDLRITNNPFIQAIRYVISKKEGYPHWIELKEKDYDTYNSNILTGALRELRDSSATVEVNGVVKKLSDIYPRILYTAIIQSGTQDTIRSFTSLLPNEDYGKLVSDATRKIDSSLDTFYTNYMVYRNLWNNDLIVPIVQPTYIEDPTDPTKLIKLSDELSSNTNVGKTKATEFQRLLGTKNPVSLLVLSNFLYKDKTVVKVVTPSKKDAEGNWSEKIVRLYRRVEGPEGDPLMLKILEVGDMGNSRYIYKTVFTEINKLGAENVQEYYDNRVHSIFKSNPFVEEINDDTIIDSLIQAGIPTNLTPDQLSIYLTSKPEETVHTADSKPIETQETSEDRFLSLGEPDPEPAAGEETGESDGLLEDDTLKNLEEQGIIKKKCD